VAQRPPDPLARGAPERSIEEALARARRHASTAVAEALEAGRALLDAASLATSGARAAEHPIFGRADAWIRDASGGLAASGGLPSDLAATLADALDTEIARWEQRAHDDGDARAVLRAFLGLREMLWEIGVRPSARGGRATPPPRREPLRDAAEERRPRARRVERVSVQG
jgi:hypothetical protein